jgi:hypothetical protein
MRAYGVGSPRLFWTAVEERQAWIPGNRYEGSLGWERCQDLLTYAPLSVNIRRARQSLPGGRRYAWDLTLESGQIDAERLALIALGSSGADHS